MCFVCDVTDEVEARGDAEFSVSVKAEDLLQLASDAAASDQLAVALGILLKRAGGAVTLSQEEANEYMDADMLIDAQHTPDGDICLFLGSH